MTTSTELQRDIDWAAYEAEYDAARKQAIDEMTCFCRCGCRAPVEALGSWGSPARCEACQKGHKSVHVLTPRAVETFPWEKYEPKPEVQPRRATRHKGGRISRKRRREATEVKANERIYLRAASDEYRASRRMDINRVSIGPDIEAGDYAVKDDRGQPIRVNVARPASGPLTGFVVVTVTFGGGEHSVQGVQYPGPKQAYRGEAAHLVARLVANPLEAKALFELASEVEAAAEEAA